MVMNDSNIYDEVGNLIGYVRTLPNGNYKAVRLDGVTYGGEFQPEEYRELVEFMRNHG